MRKRIPLLLSTALSVVILCAVLVVAPQKSDALASNETVSVYNSPIVVAPADENTETVSVEVVESAVEIYKQTTLTKEEMGTRFIKMLNINYCYGEGFENEQKIIDSAALTLRDYSVEFQNHGICVNDILVEGFVESFYGKSITANSKNAPKGYVLVPEVEIATQYHRLVSVSELDGVYEVVTEVTFYYGGDDVETSVAVSKFARNTESDFGFSLLSCKVA